MAHIADGRRQPDHRGAARVPRDGHAARAPPHRAGVRADRRVVARPDDAWGGRPGCGTRRPQRHPRATSRACLPPIGIAWRPTSSGSAPTIPAASSGRDDRRGHVAAGDHGRPRRPPPISRTWVRVGLRPARWCSSRSARGRGDGGRRSSPTRTLRQAAHHRHRAGADCRPRADPRAVDCRRATTAGAAVSGGTLFGLCAALLVGIGLTHVANAHPLRKNLAFNIVGSGVFLMLARLARRARRRASRRPVPQAPPDHRHRRRISATALAVACCCGCST